MKPGPPAQLFIELSRFLGQLRRVHHEELFHAEIAAVLGSMAVILRELSRRVRYLKVGRSGIEARFWQR